MFIFIAFIKKYFENTPLQEADILHHVVTRKGDQRIRNCKSEKYLVSTPDVRLFLLENRTLMGLLRVC